MEAGELLLTTQRHIPEDGIQIHRCDNLRCDTLIYPSTVSYNLADLI
jgi:hypothetical protein